MGGKGISKREEGGQLFSFTNWAAMAVFLGVAVRALTRGPAFPPPRTCWVLRRALHGPFLKSTHNRTLRFPCSWSNK